ncbi:hypothetical protein [Roseateles amylovorans]|uniref:Uncharacterized protein n=1 Tax=Roseateles amylovorans TaxID=2978473 RepID=A0ABY6B2F3_9BURK|nr:hypothetical protein [Roseateles amylovorans]UXH79578.1 hypothetical protein N4261_06570 [Roseateles amylovorans]
MNTITLNLPLQVMPSDVARVNAARQGGERVVALGSQLGHSLRQLMRELGQTHPRAALMNLASEQAAERPELAASLRRAARRSWMD